MIQMTILTDEIICSYQHLLDRFVTFVFESDAQVCETTGTAAFRGCLHVLSTFTHWQVSAVACCGRGTITMALGLYTWFAESLHTRERLQA